MPNGSANSKRIELGQVLLNLQDQQLVAGKVIPCLSSMLLQEKPWANRPYRPPRMGVELPPGRLFAWAVRYAIVRSEYDHGGWHERIRKAEHRRIILADRKCVGVCRVLPQEADLFRLACQPFKKIICPGERIIQTQFLTLAVVGFAWCVVGTQELHDLTAPPWAIYVPK